MPRLNKIFWPLTCTWSLVIWMIFAHEGHDHYIPRADRPEDIKDKRLLRDTRHIKEDIEKYFQMNMTAVDHLSPENLDYYYFVLHDFDQNSQLDGLEMLKAIQHVVEHWHQENEDPNKVMPTVDNFAIAIDFALQTDDLNKDGFLSYAEYVYSQRREQEQTTPAPVDMVE